jgi:hypothetical protein
VLGGYFSFLMRAALSVCLVGSMIKYNYRYHNNFGNK